MEQSTPDPMANLQSDTETAGDLPPDYLSTFEPYYTPPLNQFNPQDLQQPQQQSLGIGWDHPVVNQRPQSSNGVPQIPNHGIYSQPSQSWQPNPLRQPLMSSTHDFAAQSQYGQQQSYAHPTQLTYEPQYSFRQGFYPSHEHSSPNTIPQQTSLRNIQPRLFQSTPYEPAARSASIPQYTVSSSLSGDLARGQVGLQNDFTGSLGNVADQQTINPQFLGVPSQPTSTNNSPPSRNTFLYMTPSDFEMKSSGR